MTVSQRVRMTFGPLVVAALAGVLCGYLLNPSSVSGQIGPAPPVGNPVLNPGLAQRIADLEDRVDQLEAENKELWKCVKQLKEQVSGLEATVDALWVLIEDCCGDQPVNCREDVDCDDGNPCTEDTCDPDTGECRHDPYPNDTPCGDKAVCWDGECELISDL